MADSNAATCEYYFPDSNAVIGSVVMRGGAWTEQRDFTALTAFWVPELLAVAELAVAVRDAQKHYIKTRTQEGLIASKGLEEELDEKARKTLARIKEAA